MREKNVMIVVSIIVILMVTAPYVYAFQAADANHVFGGFLINPIDGHSYLAKMQLGYRGEWKFTLPFSSESGEGAFLFMFYITLGHIARLLSSQVILVFHTARVVGSVFLLWAISLFFRDLFEEKWQRNFGFTICAIGAGLGWIAILFDLFTSDFWVAEAFPFLSMYANPHFPIGLGLMILVLLPRMKFLPPSYFLLGLSLGFVQPFGVVIVTLVLAIKAVNEHLEMSGTILNKIKGNTVTLKTLLFGFGGGIVIVYQFIAIKNDPILSIWNLQNITSSPGILDLALSISPCLLLAIPGIKKAWQDDRGKLLIFWSFINLVMIFIPWNLQRRFITGIYVPLSGLAVFGLEVLISKRNNRQQVAATFLLFLVIPTNLIVILSGLQASRKMDPAIYLGSSTHEALSWIMTNTQQNSVFLADEDSGLYIPSYTGRRVVYGHPFETIHAEQELTLVESFFEGKMTIDDIKSIVRDRDIHYIFSRTESDKINELHKVLDFPIVFNNSDVIIYDAE